MASIPNIAQVVPGNIIRLYNISDVDTTYRNVKRFTSNQDCDSYFSTLENFSVLNAKVIRMPDRLRLPYRAEWVRQFNYMSFDNHMSYMPSDHVTNSGSNGGSPDGETVHNNRIYAFITSVEWVNIQCCDVFYEIDVFTSYFWKLQPLTSFIARSHIYQTPNEKIGDNILSEPVSVSDYKRNSQVLGNSAIYQLDSYDYIIGYNPDEVGTTYINGILSVLRYRTFTSTAEISTFVKENPDRISTVFQLPHELIKGGVSGNNQDMEVSKASYNDTVTITIPKDFEGYIPKNKKCLTYPFSYLEIVSPKTAKVFRYELFDEHENNVSLDLGFRFCGTDSTLYCVPQKYDGVNSSITDGVINGFLPEITVFLDGFPTCQSEVDPLSEFIRNGGLIRSLQGAGSKVIGGAGAVGVGIGAGSAGSLASGVASILSGITDPIIDIAVTSMQPDRTTGAQTNSVNFVSGSLNIRYSTTQAHVDEIKPIDDFFEQFGYSTNLLDVPNFNIRPYWCYYEIPEFHYTWDSISYCIPNSAIATIRNALKTGVTFWDKDTHFGDYTKDNHTS